MNNIRQSRPPFFDINNEKKNEKKNATKKNLAGALCALSILSIAAAIIALAIGILAYGGVGNNITARSYTASGEIAIKPYTAHLDSSAAPIAMTLPNDLTPYIGMVRAIYTTTAQPHTVTIQSGTYVSTWDGINTVATFGGAIGDGLTYRVISKNRITILPPTNIVFT
ncbi:hypothetical protein OAB94_02150 [Flavobacteriaceae bacterium]|nr:hypothetical protein [Flavobacteriaceae bacterium]